MARWPLSTRRGVAGPSSLKPSASIILTGALERARVPSGVGGSSGVAATGIVPLEHDSSADQGHHRVKVGQAILVHCQRILARDEAVGELADLDRAAPLLVEQEPRSADRRGAQRLLAS